MFCSNCGTSIPDSAAFCPSCGSPTGAAPAQQQPTRAQYQGQAQTAPYAQAAPQPQGQPYAQAAPQPQGQPYAQQYAQPAYAQQPAYAGVAAPAAKKSNTGKIIAIVAVAVVAVALIAGLIALITSANKSDVMPGSYNLVASDSYGSEYNLFSASVSEDLFIRFSIDGNETYSGQLEQADSDFAGCTAYDAVVEDDGEYSQILTVEVPEGAAKGNFEGLWYLAETNGYTNDMGGVVETSYESYGFAAIFNADGTGTAFFVDGYQYLPEDEALSHMGDEVFQFTWTQTGPGTIQGEFTYYDEPITFTASIPVKD